MIKIIILILLISFNNIFAECSDLDSLDCIQYPEFCLWNQEISECQDISADSSTFDYDCIPADAAKLVITTFGTYIYMGLSDENLVEVVMGNWEWGNEEQTVFNVTGGPGDALNSSATINNITDTQLSFTFLNINYDTLFTALVKRP